MLSKSMPTDQCSPSFRSAVAFDNITTGCAYSIDIIRVRMKRWFRQGMELSKRDFHGQEWTRGMLQFQGAALYLCLSSPDNLPAPYGILYRPTLKACFSETITFTGFEQENEQWFVQVWYCEVGSRRD
jgi:hypothetical protein